MCTVNDIMISTATLGKKETPKELFCWVNIAPKTKHFHTLGCPVYVLDNALQGQCCTQVEEQVQTQDIFRTIMQSFKNSAFNSQPMNTACFPTISCKT